MAYIFQSNNKLPCFDFGLVGWAPAPEAPLVWTDLAGSTPKPLPWTPLQYPAYEAVASLGEAEWSTVHHMHTNILGDHLGLITVRPACIWAPHWRAVREHTSRPSHYRHATHSHVRGVSRLKSHHPVPLIPYVCHSQWTC